MRNLFLSNKRIVLGDSGSESRVYVFGSSIMQTHVPEGQPRGHPFGRCPSWLVGKELKRIVPFDQVLGREFDHKLNRIVVCDNLFFHACQNSQTVHAATSIGPFESQRVELLLLFLVEIIEIKKRVPGQTPPIFQRVQNLGGLASQEGIGRPESVPQLDHPFPPSRGARRR